MALTLDKVLISDAVDASCCSILKTHGVNVDYRPGLSKDELLSIIKVTFLASLSVQYFMLIYPVNIRIMMV